MKLTLGDKHVIQTSQCSNHSLGTSTTIYVLNEPEPYDRAKVDDRRRQVTSASLQHQAGHKLQSGQSVGPHCGRLAKLNVIRRIVVCLEWLPNHRRDGREQQKKVEVITREDLIENQRPIHLGLQDIL